MFMGYCSKEHLPKRFRLLNYLKVSTIALKTFNDIDIFTALPRGSYVQLIERIEEWYVLYSQIECGEVQEGGALDEFNITTENNKEDLDKANLAYYKEVNQYFMDNQEEELKEFTYFHVFEAL